MSTDFMPLSGIHKPGMATDLASEYVFFQDPEKIVTGVMVFEKKKY